MTRDKAVLRVLVTGDRDWTDYALIKAALAKLPPGTLVIEGGAPGADRLARQAAEQLGLRVIEVRAEWEKYGPSAGPRRNRAMLDYAPELVLAFHDDLENSKGTKDMVTQAQRRDIEVLLYKHGSGCRPGWGECLDDA
jgi:hypothetical protein